MLLLMAKETVLFNVMIDPHLKGTFISLAKSFIIIHGMNYIFHPHINFGSILKTRYNITVRAHVNHIDITASRLREIFISETDYTPCTLECDNSRFYNAE